MSKRKKNKPDEETVTLFGRRLTYCWCGYYHPVDEHGAVDLNTGFYQYGKVFTRNSLHFFALFADEILPYLGR